MNKKSMEEFVKENGTYDEKEDSYFFSCSQADVVKDCLLYTSPSPRD